ncbi:YfzA family protein [Alkalihalobacillus sp. NPDC078783]
MQENKEGNSLFKSIIGGIVTFLIVQLVFIVISITSWEPNRREGENVLNNLIGLFPDGLFREYLAPYQIVEFNAITFLMAGAMFIIIFFQFLFKVLARS